MHSKTDARRHEQFMRNKLKCLHLFYGSEFIYLSFHFNNSTVCHQFPAVGYIAISSISAKDDSYTTYKYTRYWTGEKIRCIIFVTTCMCGCLKES